jgi:hypothetical protein
MFSLTCEDDGIPIAKILGTKQFININPLAQSETKMNEISFETKNEIAPLPTQQRQIIWTAGSQGSGKTYRTASYINFWLQIFPNKKVYVISCHENDETFDSKEFKSNIEDNIIRLKPNIEWLKDKFDLEIFSNSLVVFDDIVSSKWIDYCENIKEANKLNNMVQNYIYDLLLDMVQNGRHNNIHMLITSHTLYSKKKIISDILQDCTDYIIFPQTTGSRIIKYFLREYIGFKKIDFKNFDKISNTSRWILIHKNHPKYIMYPNGIIRYNM